MLSEPTEGLTSEQTGKPDTSVTETVKITTSNTTATIATSAESGSIPWTVIIIFLVLLLIAVFICCSLKMRKKLEDELVAYMEKTVPKKYHEILTPDYGVGCKRRIFDATWLIGLNDPLIELTTLPLTSVGEKTVTLGPGRTYPDPKITTSSAPTHEVTVPADVIILANGFQTTKWLHPLDITGRDGRKLHDVFNSRGGPSMYMGMALDGFPNLFTIFGPNTATGHSSVILASENMVNMSLKFIKPILDGDVTRTEIKKEAELEWDKDTQGALKKRVWHTGGCRSWYETAEGWNSTVYP